MADDRLTLATDVQAAIRSIPDFPKPGILFRDITTALMDGPLFARVCDHFSGLVREKGCNVVAGIESRGFIFGAPVAAALRLPLALIRKPGKLPWKTRSVSYDLEYGTDTIEMHEDAVKPGDRVALVDDLLATGGTAGAAVRLIHDLGGEVALVTFLIELEGLNGRAGLDDLHVDSLVVY
ncbi:MAG: adenine phosphoribosyltransferase [Deltaproteobacteria bacterium]|nr:adenine phosphoribosyltransferase [Deltaproteobacteria bacterium]